MKSYDSFEDWMKDQSRSNQSTIRALRTFIREIAPQLQEAACFWMDTFHRGGTAMICRGEDSGEFLSVEGHYYGGDEKWGGRMEFRKLNSKEIEMKHFNIDPEGKADRAVESLLKRVGL